MPVFYNEINRTFKLRAKDTDYMMKVVDEGYLAHVYYGGKLPDDNLGYLLRFDESPFTPATNNRDKASFMDTLPLEYPCFGIGDYRDPAFKILDEQGMSTCDMRYDSYKIYPGKPKLSGLPATFETADSPADTLEIVLVDKHSGLEVTLIYTAFEKLDSYSDSAEKVLEIRCAYARSLSEEDRYDQALEQVKLAGDYKDSAAVMEEIKLNQYVYSIRVQLYNATHPTDDKITDAYKNIAALNKAIKDIEAHTKGMQLNECNAKFYENIKKVQPYLGNWKCTRPKDFVLTYYANSNLVVIEPIYDIIGDSFQLRMYGAKSAKSYNDREYHDFLFK